MKAIFEATLRPKHFERRLEALAREALPCHAATVFDGNPEDGLTVALHLDSGGRGDVLDLARVVEDDAAVQATCGWSLLAPSRRHPRWRLLLRVSFERPVTCTFTAVFHISEHPSDVLRGTLPLVLAADRFVFNFDGQTDPELPLVWIAAPTVRDCVFHVCLRTGV
jgi:hypothetical protein